MLQTALVRMIFYPDGIEIRFLIEIPLRQRTARRKAFPASHMEQGNLRNLRRISLAFSMVT